MAGCCMFELSWGARALLRRAWLEILIFIFGRIQRLTWHDVSALRAKYSSTPATTRRRNLHPLRNPRHRNQSGCPSERDESLCCCPPCDNQEPIYRYSWKSNLLSSSLFMEWRAERLSWTARWSPQR